MIVIMCDCYYFILKDLYLVHSGNVLPRNLKNRGSDEKHSPMLLPNRCLCLGEYEIDIKFYFKIKKF